MSGTDFITATQPDGMDGVAAAPTTNDAAEDTNNRINESALKDNTLIAVDEVASEETARTFSPLSDNVDSTGIELPY